MMMEKHWVQKKLIKEGAKISEKFQKKFSYNLFLIQVPLSQENDQ